MNRIEQRLGQLTASGRKALVNYIVAGDPNLAETLAAMHSLVEQGTDIIELGVPFSDPSAEGPVIQKAHERALASDTSLKAVLRLVRDFRKTDAQTPVVLMGYANPIEWVGYENFAAHAADAGVDGVLTVDIPPEEANELNAALVAKGLVNVFLLAPTTSEPRIKAIAKLASGFLYYVSLKGTTGSGKLNIDEVIERLTTIRRFTDLPVCVGFGIKSPEAAAAVARVAEGVVVGSALIEIMARAHSPQARQAALSAFCSGIRSAIDQIG